MPRIDSTAVLKRIDELLALPGGITLDQRSVTKVVNLYSGTLSLCVLVYGPDSPQVSALKNAEKTARTTNAGSYLFEMVAAESHGALETVKAEVQQGLIGSIARQGQGAVLADLVVMAREELGSKHVQVAAVLAAAAFEDTVRRMGETMAGVYDRRHLSQVLEALKGAGVLSGAPFTTASGYLKFRNDALHADWEQLDHATVSSVLAFVEGLVLQHFS